ncbi:MAG: gamma-glutamyltransferase [Fretibacterium sp.]|nr:gamma-glutamyltransferase [Fretibacterium sp.]
MRKLTCILLAAFVLSCSAAFAVEVHDVYADKAMVSSAHELASRAGVEILKQGGNAIDATVATMLALNVVEPAASGIGGGGFSLIRFAKTGEVVFLDYRETAPASATKDMYASEQAKKELWSLEGGKAVGVPGMVLGIFTALEKYGTMTFAQVAEPAIRLAEEGFEVEPSLNTMFMDKFNILKKFNEEKDIPYFSEGLPLSAGETLKQPLLAATFRLLGEKGPSAFYDGPIGEAVVKAVNSKGGAMTLEDLKSYRLEVREPVFGTYRGYKIYSAGPASSGGTHILETLNILENFDLKALGHNTPDYLHLMAETYKRVFADRQKYMADPAFTKVPLKGLTHKGYAAELAKGIDMKKASQTVTPGDPWPWEEGKKAEYKGDLRGSHHSTTHFSVVDAEGNIVASTNTINYWLGSGVIVPEYGFALNNQMDDFAQDPESVNAPEPGKRPLSSMSPTIMLTEDDKPFMTLGAAGAWRIISGVCQTILNVVDFGMTMDQAIEAPRIFCASWNGEQEDLDIETEFPQSVMDDLKARGHKVHPATRLEDGGSFFGTVQAILFKDGKMNGGADSRRLGVPVGY